MATKQEKRDLILAKASEVFIQYGYKKTTIEDIARHAGLERASVYYYFKSKEAIFTASVEHEAGQRVRMLQAAAIRAETAEEKLRAVVHAHSKGESELVALVAGRVANMVQLLPRAQQVIGTHRRMAIDLFKEILTFGVERGEFAVEDPGQLADGIHALLFGATLGGLLGITEEGNAGLEVAVEAIIQGIRSEA